MKLSGPTDLSSTSRRLRSQTRWKRLVILNWVTVIGLFADVSFAGVMGVHITGVILNPPVYTSDDDNPDPPPNDCIVPVCLDLCFDFDILTECDFCAGTEGPEMRIVALDCDGHVVAEEHRSFPPSAPCSSPPVIEVDPFTDLEVVFPACSGDSLIRRVDVFTAFDHINTIPSTSDCSSPSEVKWNPNPSASFDIPLPDMSCSLTDAELACFSCQDVNPLPLGSLVVYKSGRSLYGLSTDDSGGSSFGEVVNGTFMAPGPGLLLIEALTSTASVSTWTATISGDTFLGGWYTQAGSTGSPLSGQRCFQTSSAGQPIDFHIRVGRVDSHFDYSLKFTWIAADSRGCCFERFEEVVAFHVLPFSDETQSSDSSIPTRLKWLRHDGSVDYEMTLPVCASCAGGECHSENMSAPFIAWPTLGGTVIREGHARGWLITPTSLQTPGPQSTVYQY